MACNPVLRGCFNPFRDNCKIQINDTPEIRETFESQPMLPVNVT
ncbi:hypothetical protein TRICHSKD4_0576 [Roseibium sp. TrichSKD4]|nr:hypothetical protein TRICHSKD4_0576 [Roseibium sp. TrichSKD4]